MERDICPIAAVCTVVEILSQIHVASLTLWLHDVIGHVTTLFVILDFLTALYWNWHKFKVCFFSHFGAICI